MASQVGYVVGEKCGVEEKIMRDFYVQLISSASTNEFPNKANSFKNRLPQPLVFDDGNRKVGVVNIAYPTPHVRPDQPPLHSPPNFESDDLICRINGP